MTSTDTNEVLIPSMVSPLRDDAHDWRYRFMTQRFLGKLKRYDGDDALMTGPTAPLILNHFSQYFSTENRNRDLLIIRLNCY